MEENMELALLLVNFMKKMVTTVRHPAVEDKEMKLTSHAFNALWILDRPQDSPVTMTALAEQMGISSQQLTKLINELEGRSLGARQPRQEEPAAGACGDHPDRQRFSAGARGPHQRGACQKAGGVI